MFVASGAKRSLPAPLLALFFPLWYVCYSAAAGGGRETETEDASYVDTGYIWFEIMLCPRRWTWIAPTSNVHNINSPLCPRLLRTSGAQKYLFRCCLLLLLLLLLLFLPLGGEGGEESGGGLFLGATTRNGSSLSVFLVLRGWPDDRRRGDPILNMRAQIKPANRRASKHFTFFISLFHFHTSNHWSIIS